MAMNRITYYRKVTGVMGLWGGVKFLAALWLHRRMYLKFIGKRDFRIKIYGHPFYLRFFSRDLDFAYTILICAERRQGALLGEYDIDIPEGIDGILDLGANIGLFTVLYALRYPEVKIVSLEPENNNYALLMKNVEGLKNVTTIQSAVWYRDAYVKVCPSRVMMEVSHTTSEGAFYVEECAPTDAGGSLNGISIDTLIDKYKLSNYIVKMDVEGAEKVIFEHHALDWLCDECKMLIIETHEDFFPGSGLSERIHEEMTSRNYVMERMGENKVYRKKC